MDNQITRIVSAISRLQEKLYKATRNAESHCYNVEIILSTDGSCGLKYYWSPRSFATHESAQDRALDQLFQSIMSDETETFDDFRSIQELEDHLIVQRCLTSG